MLNIGIVGIDHPTYYASELNVFENSMESFKLVEDIVSVSMSKYLHTVDEAKEFVAKIEEKKIDALIIQNSGFSTGDFAMVLENTSLPIIIWTVEEPTSSGDIKLHSMVSTNLFASIAKRVLKKNGNIFWLYGDLNSIETQNSLKAICEKIQFKKNQSQQVVAQIGGVAPTFFNLETKIEDIQEGIGCKVIYFEVADVMKKYNEVTVQEEKSAKEVLRKKISAFKVDEQALSTSIKLAVALSKIFKEKNISAAAVSCWPDFQDELGIVPCLAFTLASELSSTAISCEGDLGAAVTMLLVKEISPSLPTVMDLTAISKDEKALLLWHCGICTFDILKKQGNEVINQPMMNRKDSQAKKFGCSIDGKFDEGKYTILRVTDDFSKLFYFVAENLGERESGFDGTRGYLENMRQNGNTFTAKDILNSILSEGIEHHLVVAKGDLEKEIVSLGKMLNLHIIAINKI